MARAVTVIPATANNASPITKTTVLSILQNKKYKGDAVLQKKYIVDFLTKKIKRNEGEVPHDSSIRVTPKNQNELSSLPDNDKKTSLLYISSEVNFENIYMCMMGTTT